MRERFQTYGLSLVRRGLFVRHTRRTDQIGDSTVAYFEQPGLEHLVSHPLPVPGNTTVIVLSEAAMARYAGDLSMPDRPIPVTPDVHLDHAVLLSDVRAGIDEVELDARLTWLIGRLVETATQDGSPRDGRQPQDLISESWITCEGRSRRIRLSSICPD